MQLEEFISKLESSPSSIEFQDTMAVIETLYQYVPAAFTNGRLTNLAGENEGSCKLFAFAKLHDFSKQQTLDCFGAYYRDEVLANPKSNNHLNIRNFMQTGWEGIKFESDALKPR